MKIDNHGSYERTRSLWLRPPEPGRIAVCAYTPQQLMAEWEVFKMACAIWRHTKGYDPREEPANG